MLRKKEPFLIGVAGGISSGKSSVCKKIIDELAKLNHQHHKHVLIISLDSFYKQMNDEDRQRAERNDINLDHPEAFDEELAYDTLTRLIKGQQVVIPHYDKKSYRIVPELAQRVDGDKQDVVIIEGILVFFYQKIRDLCQMKLFVDCDADTRLARRVLRDMKEYNRPLDQVLAYYQKFVKTAFEDFCLPTKKYADVIIPRGAENQVAINLIVQHLNDYLNNSNLSKLAATSMQINRTTSDRGSSSKFVAFDESNDDEKIEQDDDDGASSVASSITPQKSSSSSSLLGKTASPNTPNKKNEFSSRPH